MNRSFKFVAGALALVLLGGSLSVFGCVPGRAAAMSGHCGPHCPMMKARLSGTAVQVTPQGTSCCDISSGKPMPASALIVPTSKTPSVVPPQVAHLLAPVSVTPLTEPRDRVPIVAGSPPQALLCIFLI